MNKSLDTDKLFSGSIAQLYEQYLVPLIFQPYAHDLAKRLAGRTLGHVLEIAAGTGVVTRALDATLPAGVAITATDLNQPMLDEAAKAGMKRAVRWQQADAMQLPFEDGTFDAVVCQFGVMFFPDRPKAYAEARRVLRPGGVFLFNTWDRIEENEFPDTVTRAIEPMFPGNPPRFMVRTPHGYFDTKTIRADLERAGFRSQAEIVTVTCRSRAAAPDIPALAFCQGTPMRNEIEARDPSRLLEATRVAAAAIAKRFGNGAVDGKIQAHVAGVTK
jgi:ubiquinone/menaquinone biosynthesis C-methylase UbiE